MALASVILPPTPTPERAAEAIQKAAELVQYAVGEVHAEDLLSQWAGFGRFCREQLGVEPLTVLRAFGLGQDDPAAEVLAKYPES